MSRRVTRFSAVTAAMVLGMVAAAGVAEQAQAGSDYTPTYAGNTTYDSKPAPVSAYYPQAKKSTASAPKKKSSGVKVAALGKDGGGYTPKKQSLTGGSVNWVASSGCLDGSLKSVIYQVAANFGPVTVSSTCRSKSRNASVGGAPKSKHLTGDAADFRVHGNVSATYAFLKNSGSVGGLKHYGGGLFHIDNGDRRSW